MWSTVKTLAFWTAVYVIRPARDMLRSLLGRHPVRVFTYHRVTDACRDPLTISPQVFRRQLRYVMRYHHVTSLDEAVASLERGDRRRRPLAAITFDDGYESVLTTAFPIMRELGVPGCSFVVTEYVGTERRLPHDEGDPAAAHLTLMGWPDLQALRESGWSIGSHTASHARLSECDGEELRLELEQPVRLIRQRLGADPVFFAFPFGGETDISRAAVETAKAVGYRASFSNFGGDNRRADSGSPLFRTDIGASDLPTLAWQARVHGMPPLWLRKLLDRLRR